MTIDRTFAGAAPATTLATTMSSIAPGSGGTVLLGDGTGWPTAWFVGVIDRGTVNEETVLFASRSGSTCIIAGSGRAFDGTAAKAHDIGATVEHQLDADVLNQIVAHVNDETPEGVHPFLMRREEHTPEAHAGMGFMNADTHTTELHTDALGLYLAANHTLVEHTDLGLMSNAQHTQALHTGSLGLMKTADFTKAAIDAKLINATELGGITKAELKAYLHHAVQRQGTIAGANGNISTTYVTKAQLVMSSMVPPDATVPCIVHFGGHVLVDNSTGSNRHVDMRIVGATSGTSYGTTTALANSPQQVTMNHVTYQAIWTASQFETLNLQVRVQSEPTLAMFDSAVIWCIVRGTIPAGA